jgi:hypothetical protein
MTRRKKEAILNDQKKNKEILNDQKKNKRDTHFF